MEFTGDEAEEIIEKLEQYPLEDWKCSKGKEGPDRATTTTKTGRPVSLEDNRTVPNPHTLKYDGKIVRAKRESLKRLWDSVVNSQHHCDLRRLEEKAAAEKAQAAKEKQDRDEAELKRKLIDEL